jgi:hypothetical protein
MLANLKTSAGAYISKSAPLVDYREGQELSQPLVASIRRSALVETLVFLILTIGLSYALGSTDRFLTASLHPFWIIVLLVSVQYGPREGLAAALLSSAFLLAGNLPERTLSETMYEYVWRASHVPFFWVVTALVLGAVRARQIDERTTLIEQLRSADETSSAIVEDYKHVKASKERLELRLAEERRSVLTVYEAARELETLDSIAAKTGLEHLVKIALNPKKFSLYIWKNDMLSLVSSYGWSADDNYRKMFQSNTALVGYMRKCGPALSIVNEADAALLDAQGILAAPVTNAYTGQLYGMIKIEEIGFTEMDARTAETLQALCAWTSRIYANIETYQAAVTRAYTKTQAA